MLSKEEVIAKCQKNTVRVLEGNGSAPSLKPQRKTEKSSTVTAAAKLMWRVFPPAYTFGKDKKNGYNLERTL